MFKKKSVFDKIDIFLSKRGHEKVLSVFLDSYNNNSIYIRFDYVRFLSCYKIVWFDLNFFDEKHIENYLNIQMVTGALANNLMRILEENTLPSDCSLNEDLGVDRVEIIQYMFPEVKEYIFDRFLPIEWKVLIDPIVILFTYMPRSMECFLNEIFAKFDGVEEKYTFAKPILFSLESDSLEKILKPNLVRRGREDYKEGVVTYLEKVNHSYYAVLMEEKPIGVVIDTLKENRLLFHCSCSLGVPCKHISTVLHAIKSSYSHSFYKIKYRSMRNVTLLDKVKNSSFYLCFGIKDGNVQVINTDGTIYSYPVKENGIQQFEVLEDDDKLTLSKEIESIMENED